MTKTKKNSLITLIVVTIAVSAMLLAGGVNTVYAETNTSLTQDFTTIGIPEKGSRILVVAPHCDDEALGAAEFISRSVKNDCTVKIVMVTNGDGFKKTFRHDFIKITPKPSNYIQLGYQRQNETIAAMTSVGVKRSNIYFLGYPDRGILSLWWKNFYSPYTSSFTGFDMSRYKDSYSHDLLYTGQNLASDMEKIITEFRPDCIIYPHPDDKHPDHRAVNYFVKYALAQTGQQPAKQLLYIVHRLDWPVLVYDTSLYLAPPHNLINTGTQWYSFNLTPEETQQKYAVLRKYKSQFGALNNLFMAFVRKNELFGTYPDVHLDRNNYSDNAMTPSLAMKLITDPAQDAINLPTSKKFDITGIYGEISSDNNLNIFIKTYGDINKLPVYHLFMVAFGGTSVRHIEVKVQDGNVKSEVLEGNSTIAIQSMTNGHYIHLIIPNSTYAGCTSVLISAGTSLNNRAIDYTAQRLVILPDIALQ